MKRLITFGLLLAAAATGACTSFERESSNILAPSASSSAAETPTPTPSTPSLLGAWASSPLSGISASSCTGFSWQVTSQTSDSLSGIFSATCANGISGTGTATGQITGSDVPYTVTGTATVPGFPGCAFSLSGTAHIESSDVIRIPYSGSTCLGPVSGEETLRRPTEPTPSPSPEPTPDPTPAPDATPTPTESPYHVGPGPQAMWRAEQVVNATADEFPSLTAPRSSGSEAGAAATELLRRTIWHLRHAGFEAGRQRNPSGAISGDKLTVFADGGWHAVDIFYDYGAPGVPIKVIFFEVFPASPVGDEGIPD